MKSQRKISSSRKVLIADLSILFSALLWGGDYIFAKKALDFINPGYLNAVRFSICSLILLIIVRKRLRRITKSDMIIGFITGLMMFGGFIGQTAGLKHTSVGNNAFITSTYVILVPFIAWGLTRIRPGGKNFLAVFLCIAGIGFLTLEGGSSLSRGDLITMAGAVFFGFELAILGIYAKKIDPLILAFLEAAVVAVLFWAYALPMEKPPADISRELLLSMAYITFFGSVITHIVVTVALKYTSSSHGAVLCATESLFGVVLAVIFLGEMLPLKGWIGCALVLFAVLVTELNMNMFGKKEKKPALAPPG